MDPLVSLKLQLIACFEGIRSERTIFLKWLAAVQLHKKPRGVIVIVISGFGIFTQRLEMFGVQ